MESNVLFCQWPVCKSTIIPGGHAAGERARLVYVLLHVPMWCVITNLKEIVLFLVLTTDREVYTKQRFTLSSFYLILLFLIRPLGYFSFLARDIVYCQALRRITGKM